MWFSPIRRAILGGLSLAAAGWQSFDAMFDLERRLLDITSALFLLAVSMWLLYSAYKGWRHLHPRSSDR